MPKKHRLLKRGNIYYYHRRVPPALVDALGKRVIKVSLGTSELAKATQIRSIKDVEWDARFRDVEKQLAVGDTLPVMTRANALIRLNGYLKAKDEAWAKALANDPPASLQQRKDSIEGMREEQQFLREPDHPDQHRAIWKAYQDITQGTAYTFKEEEISEQAFVEYIRRVLLELNRREIARLNDDFSTPSFDGLFAPQAASPPTGKKSPITFDDLCDAYMEEYSQNASYKGVAQKRIDKVEASAALLKEAFGENTLVSAIDYERCKAFREKLSKIPTNAKKHYPKLSLDEAILRAEAEGRPRLAYVTQELHLQTLKKVLALAVKRGLLVTVPSEGLTPWAKQIPDADKRRPFKPDELQAIFTAPIYTGCIDDGRNFAKPGPLVIRRARFWVPLIMLFTGARPNEICQLSVADVKKLDSGLSYFDINDGGGTKKLKTATSRRAIPIHSELVKIGILQYAEQRRASGDEKLFPELKAGKYHYQSQRLADWFTESFLPKVVTKDGKCSLYSLRHNFRDALRRIEAPEWVLQLGGWAPSKGVSDNYGSGYSVEQVNNYLQKVCYPELNLTHLHTG